MEKNNETNAIQNYIKQTGNHVHDCGIIINPEFSFLGSFPDGKVCDQGCVLAARPKVGHENLVFCHALKRQDRSSVFLLSMTRSWI